MKLNKKAIGSSFEDFLKEEGTFEATEAVAIKRMLAWKIQELMKKHHLAKTDLAKRMATSRAQLDRLLDPKNGAMTLDSLARLGSAMGYEVKLDFVKIPAAAA